MTRTRTGNKCLIWCVVIAIIMVAFLIFFGFVRDDSDTIIIQPQEGTDPTNLKAATDADAPEMQL